MNSSANLADWCSYTWNMAASERNRALARNRHGRGMRRPLWSSKFHNGVVIKGSFDAAVADAADYLRSCFPEDFANLRTVVTNLPPMTAPGIPLYRTHRASETVYLYRIPIERMRSRRDPIEEMIRIEEIVIEAAATMVERDPRNFLEGY